MRIRKEGMEKKQNQDYSLTADMEKAAYDILYKTDESLKESEYTYDQKFKQLYFDLEMQREKSPGYPLVKRGIYYCSRMISRQLTNLTDADYGVLRPVYSVWIIINDIPKALQYSRYDVSLKGTGSLAQESPGYEKRQKAGFDREIEKLESQAGLMHVCLVFLSEDFLEMGEEGDALIRYIQSVFVKRAGDPAYNPYAEYSRSIAREAEDSMTIMGMFEKRGEARGEARGIISNGRRHAFSDAMIIEDIAALTGCSQKEAEQILRDFDAAQP